jgi:acetyl esterase/lipase
MKYVSVFVLCITVLVGMISCDSDTQIIPPVEETTNQRIDTTLFNVAYGHDSRQQFDLYLPANRGENTPIIVMLHGGAWNSGDKTSLNDYVARIRSAWKEVAIVNMNYRLANTTGINHDAMVDDIEAVMKHLKNQKSFYHIGEKIGIMGESAGAQLAMIYAYRYDPSIAAVASIYGPTIINDWSWYDSYNIWLQAYVGDILTAYVGQPWDTTAYKAVSPYWNVNENSAPTIFFHGTIDPIVPIYQSQWLDGKLATLGVDHEKHEYLAVHAFDGEQANDVVEKLVAFFKKFLVH